MARAAPRALPFSAALLLFLLSGAGALVVETIWLRWLRALLGATAPAASATLVAFFLGQALGAAGAARFAPRSARPLALYGAAALDLLFGVLCLLPMRPRWLWPAQIALIVLYTVIISARLPEFWLEPFGPLSKNLPMLAALWLLWAMEPRARGR